MPEPKETPPPAIEGFGWHEATLTKILNRLSQLVYATMRADPAAAPVEPYPDFPHISVREQARRAPMNDMLQQLIPGGGE